MVELLKQVITPEGYLDTFYIIKDYDSRFTNLRDHHELYCFGHLAEAAVAYYEATGKGALLKLAMRFADYLCGYFGVEEGKCHGYPGHELAEMALMRLYHCTGDSRYMELSRYFVTQRGKVPKYFNREHKEPEDNNLDYCQADRPVLEQTEAVGHAVRAMYLYSGMTDLANESEDRKMGQIVQRLWEDVTGRKMYITGAVGGTHIGEAFSYAYDLPSDSAYAETCASIDKSESCPETTKAPETLRFQGFFSKLKIGLEPTTPSLRVKCSSRIGNRIFGVSDNTCRLFTIKFSKSEKYHSFDAFSNDFMAQYII